MGLHYLVIKNHEITLKMNARILNDKYSIGIGNQSLDILLDALNIKCGLKLDPSFPRDSKVSAIHVKNDVVVDPQTLINELSLLGFYHKYNRIIRDNSIQYEYTTKYDNLSTTIYGKQAEINRFKNKYKGLDIFANDFRGITRIETKFNDWRTVNKHFKTRNLAYILDQKLINHIQITNILKDQPMQLEKPDLNDFKTLSEYSDYCLIKDLNEHYKGDINAIKTFLKSKTTNPRHQIKKLDRFLPIIKTPGSTSLNAIKKMKEELKNESSLKI